MKSLSLNNARIESLVEQLYAINKRLVGLKAGWSRLQQDFINEYFGNELDQTWIEKISTKGKKWTNLVKQEHPNIDAFAATSITWQLRRVSKSLNSAASSKRVQKGEREARQAKKEMVEANLRLVISIAKKLHKSSPAIPRPHPGRQHGLMKAVDKFEYRRGYKFSTYATWWIRQAITTLKLRIRRAPSVFPCT